MEITLGKYAGSTWTDRHKSVAVTGLRELVAAEWPDVRLPADIVLIPREDWDIIQGDLVGQIYTPHRSAIALRVVAADPPKPRRPLLEWVKAIFWLWVILCCISTVGQMLDAWL